MTKHLPLAGQAANNERAITLGMLNAIHGDNTATQRSVAKTLGIALGLVNAYLKRCVTKGYVKLSKVPPNRYAYYLTPRGFAEKSRLTAEFLSQSFLLFREARQQYGALLANCTAVGRTRVAFCGNGDLAEIAGLCANDLPVTIVGVIESVFDGPGGAARLAENLAALGRVDAIVLTDMKAPQETFNALAEHVPAASILTPEFLGIARDMPR